MMMHKVSVILGTRPEAIKLAPVILEMKRCPSVVCRVCATGQHREMLNQALNDFEIRPDHDCRLMRSGQSLCKLNSRALNALDRYLAEERPDLVLVQGDTTTAFCAALAAFYHQIPIGHVEAGLRTGDLGAPWPEEAHRLLIAQMANLHFAPTERAKANLLQEHIPSHRIFVTGNTVVDALQIGVSKASETEIPDLSEDILDPSSGTRCVLVTSHRRESLGSGIQRICKAVIECARRFPEVHFAFAVHPNDRQRDSVRRGISRPQRGNIHLIRPLSYFAFLKLMVSSSLILTDSGGVQEEALILGKPVLLLRDVTDRPEGLEEGTVRIIGTDPDSIIREVALLLDDPCECARRSKCLSPYGNGQASQQIVALCVEHLAAWRSP